MQVLLKTSSWHKAWDSLMSRGCVAMLSMAPECHRTSHVKLLFSKKNTSKTKMSNDCGITLNYGLLCQCALVILAQGFMVKATGTLLCLKLPIPTHWSYQNQHAFQQCFCMNPSLHLKVLHYIFCCSNLKNMYFITVLRLHV